MLHAVLAVGCSPQIRAVSAKLHELSASDMNVLIEGEPGTGKALAARALHAASPRAPGPFVALDCSIVSHELMAAQLFCGCARLLKQIRGGTLFLDHLDDLPPGAQYLLLRALERQHDRSGGHGSDRARAARVVAASSRVLALEIAANRFRQDLCLHIAQGRVRIPPLRERREDIPVLAQHFAKQLGGTLSPGLVAQLSSYFWPGNVRELRSMVARLVSRPDPAEARPSGPRKRPRLGLRPRSARAQ